MPNLVKKLRVEVGFLWGAQKAPPPPGAGIQIYPAEDRVNGSQPRAWQYSFRTGGCQWLRPKTASL